MATIAELQIKVDSTQAEKGVKVLNDLAAAADKAAKARKALNDVSGPGNGGGGGGGGADDAEAKRTRSLSEAIDAQTRKLADLAAQRKKLNDSPMKTENPAEYARLNREIDARTELVNRQGNSLDRLAAQANKEQRAREQAAKSAQALADREAKQLEAREALQARLAASQQRQLDATIAGLSAQIKAQQEYNKTVEVLSLNRFQGKIGGPEYDTLIKMAAARRDEALATQDNTKELERNQRMLDSITATLGRAERAEVTLKRATDTLNESLRLGIVTQEQYDKQLGQHTAKRDAAVAAANNSTAAEARFSAQLKSVLSAYNPIIKATDEYANSQAILRQGLANGEINIRQYVAALKEQKAALDAVRAAQTGSPEQQAKQYQSALDRLLPFNAQLRNLAEAERQLQAAQRQGLVVTAEQIKSHEQATKAIAAERAEIERRNLSERRGNSAKQDAAALRGLPAQFTDVVVSLQGGQAPLTVLLQQGGQLKDMFGGLIPMFKAVGGALVAMITPVTVVGAALAAIAVAFYQGSHEAVDFNKAISASVGYSGVSREAFLNLQKSISSVTGTMSIAAEALIEMQKSGKISGEQFEAIGIAAVKMQRATGQAVADTVADFASLGKDPVNAVASLDEKYKFLTASVYLQIAAMQRAGDIVGATTLAQDEMAKGAGALADSIKESLGTIEKSWKAVKEGAASAWDAMRGIGREVPVEDQISKLQNRIELMKKYNQPQFSEAQGKTVFGASGLKDLQDELQTMQFALGVVNKQKEAQALLNKEKEQGRQADLRFSKQLQTDYVANLGQVTLLTDKIALLNEGFRNATERAKANGTVVESNVIETYNTTIKNLDKKLVIAKEQAARAAAGPNTPLDTREIQDVKSNLNVVLSEYDGYYKKVTALGKANVVSAEATYASQKAILQAEAKAVSASYDEQIEAIKKLQDKKGNNAAQTISLGNQMSRAEDQRTKSMQDNAAKQERLDIEEAGRIEAKTARIEAYNDALRQSITNTALAGERAATAVGQGSRQGKVNEDLGDADRQFARDQLSLSKQLGKTIDQDEYDQKLADLTKAHTDMTNQILKNDQDLKDAEGEWSNGLTRALQNHVTEAQNLAGVMESAFETAFDGMADGLSSFVTTGKLDFASLTVSILSDLAKLATKLALNTALKMVFESASAAGGWGSIISSGIGAMMGGTAMAKGGAYDGGTQFFAKGGAFTNSIVDSPTAFSSSQGRNNVMGEAGPEAIMPLARTSDGSLGVRMVGATTGTSGQGGVIVYVTIDNGGQASSDTDSSDPLVTQFGKELGAFVETKYRTLLARDLKDGGAIKSAINS